MFIAISIALVHSFHIIQSLSIDNSVPINTLEFLASIPTVFMFIGILFQLNIVSTVCLISYLLAPAIAAIKMREKLMNLNQKWDKNKLSRYWCNHRIKFITARNGIHTGSIIAGNIESDRMLSFKETYN